MVKDNLFTIPPLFETVQKESMERIGKKCPIKFLIVGHRMEIYVSENIAHRPHQILSKNFGVDAKIIGRVAKKDGHNAAKSNHLTKRQRSF